MKQNRSRILSLIVPFAILLSCSKSSSSPKSCNMTYSDPTTLTFSQQIEYLAGVSGNGGTISSVSYQDSAGTTTVNNPVLPFTVFVNLKSGATVTISAIGTANKGGQLNISAAITGIQTGVSCAN
jgi:hypothetical protein